MNRNRLKAILLFIVLGFLSIKSVTMPVFIFAFEYGNGSFIWPLLFLALVYNAFIEIDVKSFKISEILLDIVIVTLFIVPLLLETSEYGHYVVEYTYFLALSGVGLIFMPLMLFSLILKFRRVIVFGCNFFKRPEQK